MPNWVNRTAMGFAYPNLEKVNSLVGVLSPTVSGYLHQSLEVVLLPPGLQSPTVVNLILNSRPVYLDLHLPDALPATARASSARACSAALVTIATVGTQEASASFAKIQESQCLAHVCAVHGPHRALQLLLRLCRPGHLRPLDLRPRMSPEFRPSLRRSRVSSGDARTRVSGGPHTAMPTSMAPRILAGTRLVSLADFAVEEMQVLDEDVDADDADYEDSDFFIGWLREYRANR